MSEKVTILETKHLQEKEEKEKGIAVNVKLVNKIKVKDAENETLNNNVNDMNQKGDTKIQRLERTIDCMSSDKAMFKGVATKLTKTCNVYKNDNDNNISKLHRMKQLKAVEKAEARELRVGNQKLIEKMHCINKTIQIISDEKESLQFQLQLKLSDEENNEIIIKRECDNKKGRHGL